MLLFQAPTFKNNLFNTKYVSSYSYYVQEKYKGKYSCKQQFRGQAREEREGRRRAGRAKQQKQNVHGKNR